MDKNIKPPFEGDGITPERTTKIQLELTDDEFLELYGFGAGISSTNKNSDHPMISMGYKLYQECDKKAAYDLKAKLSVLLQATINAFDNDAISANKITNGLADIMEGTQKELDKLEDDMDDLIK